MCVYICYTAYTVSRTCRTRKCTYCMCAHCLSTGHHRVRVHLRNIPSRGARVAESRRSRALFSLFLVISFPLDAFLGCTRHCRSSSRSRRGLVRAYISKPVVTAPPRRYLSRASGADFYRRGDSRGKFIKPPPPAAPLSSRGHIMRFHGD